MPTAVSVARQCLTSDAAHALDEAVGVARRRGHAQTTSLHAVSALLSLPSSSLRDACTRARGGSPYSPRLQFKALELCLSVSLDRVPSGQPTEDPPVSNSLMAAIKRSQANQRRQPENFHLYHQLPCQSSSINNTIKVELQHLILSIMDDPVVSRVFGEAGFRSSEIKLAIVRPLPPHLLRYSSSFSRPPPPPMFLCNLNREQDPTGGPRFPFSVFPGFSDLDDNHRQIGEILGRSNGRNNPIVVGATASSTVKGFVQTLSLRGGGEWLFGFRVVDMESCGYDKVEAEVEKMVEEEEESSEVVLRNSRKKTETETVVVVNIGDLKSLSQDVVTGVTSLLLGDGTSTSSSRRRDMMRLMGWVVSYDAYSNFVTNYPSVDKDWELQVLPLLPPVSSVLSYPSRSRLMESFIPLGGFFSSSAAMSTAFLPPPPINHHQCSSETQKSDDAAAVARTTNNGVAKNSVADRSQYKLPSWMQMSEDAAAAQAEKDIESNNLEHNQQGIVVPSLSSDSKKNKSGDDEDASRCRTTRSGNSCESPKISISVSSSSTKKKQKKNPQSNDVDSTFATSSDDTDQQQELSDFKRIYGCLIKKVGRQHEAVRVVSQTCSMKKKLERRGDLWLSFLGPDKMGKRKLAVSLSELLYPTTTTTSSRDNNHHFIHVDLCPSPEEEESRGRKLAVDVIAQQLNSKPMAVVLLENIDKADDQVQTSLFQAIWTGKFSDSFGREVRVNRAIFITTSTFTNPKEEVEEIRVACPKYNEDTILAAATAGAAAGTRWPSVKIIVEEEEKDTSTTTTTTMMKQQQQPLLNKRELVDLNLPPAEMEQLHENQNDNSKEAWLLDFFDRTDAAVVFKPYDFDSLADNILRDLRSRLHQTVLSKECSIEVDSKVMEQLLYGVYISDSYKPVVEDWITHVETQTAKLTTDKSTLRRLTVCLSR